MDSKIVQNFNEILSEKDLEACHINLEITESAVTDDQGILKRMVRALDRMGIRTFRLCMICHLASSRLISQFCGRHCTHSWGREITGRGSCVTVKRRTCDMDRIKMKTPFVEMDGDEMTRGIDERLRGALEAGKR